MPEESFAEKWKKLSASIIAVLDEISMGTTISRIVINITLTSLSPVNI
jgi:hypothetical protein